MKKNAFTLAEIMIVLSVIAVLTAILLPVARNAMPNEDVMKFKKAHNAFVTAVRELVTSDKYYLDGDLGVKADGTLLLPGEENASYFVDTLADVLSVKKVQSWKERSAFSDAVWIINATGLYGCENCDCTTPESIYNTCSGIPVTKDSLEINKIWADYICKDGLDGIKTPQIITSDGVAFWDSQPTFTFGQVLGHPVSMRFFTPPSQTPANVHDENGLDVIYKVVCIDIDGVPEGATRDDCINECPFSYGIRADGKILNGARADEWLEKSIQDKD